VGERFEISNFCSDWKGVTCLDLKPEIPRKEREGVPLYKSKRKRSRKGMKKNKNENDAFALILVLFSW